jgi:acyl carrier protein
MTNAFEVLISCLPEGLGVRRVTPETTFVELGMDSLDFLYFLGDVEKTFQLSIPNAEIRQLRTVKDVCEWVERHQCKPA